MYNVGRNQQANWGFQNQNPQLKNFQNQVQTGINHFILVQKNGEFDAIFRYLKKQLMDIKSEMQACSAKADLDKSEGQPMYARQIRDRCLKMKANNQMILTNMLNLKVALSRSFYMSLNKDSSLQPEFNEVQEKIRRKKIQIANKLQDLKNKKMVNKKTKKEPRSKNRQDPLGDVLTQFKDAIQLLNNELMNRKVEMEYLVQHLYNQKI